MKLQVLRQLKVDEYQTDAGASLTFITSTIVVVVIVLTKEISGSIMVPNSMYILVFPFYLLGIF